MKLLIDAHVFDYPHSEGVATYIQGLYKAVILLSKDMEFYFVANNLEKLSAIFGEHNHIHYLPLSSTNKWKRLGYEFAHIIEQNGIDVAHYQYISPLTKKCKEIVTIHDVLFMDFPGYFPATYWLSKNLLFKRSALKADLLLTVSEYSRQAIVKHYKIPTEKIFITPNAVSDDFFNIEEIGLIDDIKKTYNINRYILYVSRVEPRKNHLTLAMAYILSELWKENIKLVFVGKETIPVNEFKKWYSSLSPKLQDKIVMIPQLSYQELKAMYKCCDLFVYPSIAEGFGIPPIEAAAAGKPCLCSNTTAMKDFDFFNESFFNPYDSKELSAMMRRFFDGEMSIDTERNQRYVRNNYNWGKIAEDFLETIQRELK